MPETRLVIFDCDGVLVDSERISVRLEVTLLAELGWELTEAEIAERFLGRTDQYMIEQLEAHIGHKLPPGWPEETALRYREALAAELRPVDGVVEALDRIDVQTCVASSGSHDKMAFTLGLTGLYPRFDGRIFSSSEVANGKPAPDLFLHAARRLGVAPAHCVVVEDSSAGVAAARNAGMRALGYAGGLTPAHRLEGPGTTVFSDMRELPELIRAS
jgi:HAD superfamily hydrolase (TIGR01509 family)